MKATKTVPDFTGWYWFKAGENSPTPTGFLSMGLWVVVKVSHLPGKDGSLKVFFPQAEFTVNELKGWWSKRLEEPEGGDD